MAASAMSAVNAIVSLLLLLTTVAAGAQPPFTDDPAVSWAPANATESTCGPSTFALATGVAPADWRHCAALASAWGDHTGVFTVADPDGGAFVPVLVSGECTLAVRAARPSPDRPEYAIGDGDVAEILDKALLEYSQGTDLGVRGTASCDVEGGRAGLQWQIFDSSV